MRASFAYKCPRVCFKFSAADFKILNLLPPHRVYPQELSRQLKFICGANLGAKIKFYLARKVAAREISSLVFLKVRVHAVCDTLSDAVLIGAFA